MGNKKKNRPLAPRDAKRQELAKRGYIASLVLMVCAIAKTATSAFFDLGAISLITGEIRPDLAVESGFGRICLIVAMLIFIAAAFGLKIRNVPAETDIKRIILVNVLIAVCCLVVFAMGLSDGHNPLDILASLVSATVCAYVAWTSRQVLLY